MNREFTAWKYGKDKELKYPKINSLWKRQGWHLEEGKKNNAKYQAGGQSLIIGDYAQDEFAQIKIWNVQEKIDGTNIRVIFSAEDWNLTTVFVHGRTDASEVPKHLNNYIEDHFFGRNVSALEKLMPNLDGIVLFGEGYGPKIQTGGGNYRDDVGFILFDVWSGTRWSTREEVKQIAEMLALPTPYDYGLMTEDEIIALVKSKPQSPSAIRPMELEGVICRSEPLMIRNSDNNPVMWKLKCKEFMERIYE